MGPAIPSPFFAATTGYPWLQNQPTYVNAASSGGQGNIAPNLVLESSSGFAIRADNATTKSNCMGVCTRVLESDYGENPRGYIDTNTAGKLEIVSFADLIAAGNKGYMVFGEDGDTSTIKALAVANGWTIGVTTIYVGIINETDIVSRVGLPASQFIFKQKLDSSTAATTQNNLFLSIIAEWDTGNQIPLSSPTTASTAATSWLVKFVN